MKYLEAAAPSASTLDVYIREIKQAPLLTAAEEVALAAAIARGDAGARARMIRANLRLVVTIAHDYAGGDLPIGDLIGEGNLGLLRAATEFNPAFGTRFSTYASYWIKQAIRHAFTNTTAAIRLPAHMVTLLTRWRRAERSLARELGHEPTEEQVAVQLGLTDPQVEIVRRARQADRLRFESGLSGEHDGREAPDARIEADDERRLALRRLDRLDDRERSVVSMRFGLDGADPMTLKEVGRRVGVTREGARKLELRALAKLREPEVHTHSAPAR